MRKNIEKIICTNPDTGESNINILAGAIEPISMNIRMRQKIDVIYNKNKAECYKLAKENYYFDFPLFSNGDIVKEEYCKRLLGVHLLADINSEVSELLLLSYKQVYPHIYKYIEENEEIDFNQVNNICIKDMISVMEIMEIFSVCYLLCSILGKKIIEDEWVESYHYSLLTSFAKCFSKLERKVLHEKGLLSNYSLDKVNAFNYDSFDNECRKKIKKIKERLTERIGIDTYQIHIYPQYKSHENIGIIRTAIELIMESEGLSLESFLTNYKFKEKDIDEIIGAYYCLYKNQNIASILEFTSYMFPIKILSNEYIKLKKRYFENHKENLLLEMKEMNKRIQDLINENEKLNKELNQANNQILYLKNEYKKGLEKEIFTLNKANRILETENQELTKEKKELIALREYLFSKDNNKYNQDDLELEIPCIRAIIFGGYENWQNRLKGELPETFRFESGLNERFDERILDNAEIVFLNVESCMNHGVYYKIMNYVRKRNITVAYIKSTNVEIVRKEIAYKIKNEIKDVLETAS